MRKAKRTILTALQKWTDREKFPDWNGDGSDHADAISEFCNEMSVLLVDESGEGMIPLDQVTHAQRQVWFLASYSSCVASDCLWSGVLCNEPDMLDELEAAAKEHGSKPILQIVATVRNTLPQSFFESKDGDIRSEWFEKHEDMVDKVEAIADSKTGESARLETMRLAAVIALEHPDDFFET